MAEKKIYKIIVVGDPAVGKTSLVAAYRNNAISESYIPTLVLEIHSTNTLNLWDCAGQENMDLIRQGYYYGMDAAIVVFDLTRLETLNNIPKWFEELRKTKNNIPIILVGNKSDLNVGVKASDIRTCYDKVQPTAFFLTSAKKIENVFQLFESLERTIIKALQLEK